MHTKKAPDYDLITGRILKELPEVGLRAITFIYNSVMQTGYFPAQWKVSQIITILKPGKTADEFTSYRPISLLPILSKLFEKFFLTRLQPLLHEQRTLPDHQFGFRQKHATIEQVHRVTNAITEALENHKCCTAAFLDISKAFDKVWHEGLICKLRQLFPASTHKLLRSYLGHRYFQIKYREALFASSPSSIQRTTRACTGSPPLSPVHC